MGKQTRHCRKEERYTEVCLDPSETSALLHSHSSRCRWIVTWLESLYLPFSTRKPVTGKLSWMSRPQNYALSTLETFGDIQGVHIIADDMIIAASSEQERDEILDKVMEEGEI